MNGGDDPLSVRRESRVVEVMDFPAVRVRSVLAGFQVVKDHSLGRVIDYAELFELLGEVGDSLAVRRPKRLSGVVSNLATVFSIDVHYPEAAHGGPSRSHVREECDHRSIRRSLRVNLMAVRRVRQVPKLRSVRIHDEELPVVIRIAFADQFVRGTGEQGLDGFRCSGSGVQSGGHQ